MINPVGKEKSMKGQVTAQKEGTSIWDNFIEESNKELNEKKEPSQNILEDNQLQGQAPVEQKKDFKGSLTDFVMNKMVEYGYPERLVMEKRHGYVKDEILRSQSGEFNRNATIEIPYIKYPVPGQPIDELQGKDIEEFAAEVSDKFALKLESAKRGQDGKTWVMKFTSESKEESREEDLANKVSDPGKELLDEIYGEDKSVKSKSSSVQSDDYWQKVAELSGLR